MRFAAPAWIALALMSGCLRFGYGPVPSKLDSGVDSGMTRPDGSTSDRDASDPDAADDAAVLDAGDVPGDGGGSGNGATDAGGMLDAGLSDSGEPDSGMIDSGAADSGTTDSGVEPDWTEDCPGMPGVLFCDDFEDGLAKWDKPTHNRGSTARTMDEAHAGSYAMRATTSASTATVQSKALLPVHALGNRKSGDLWARYFYFLPRSVTLTDKFASGVIAEREPPTLGFSVLIYPDGVGLESGLRELKNTLTTFPRDEWVCVEMHVQIADAGGLFEFFMNGAHITELTDLDTLPDQGYTTFEIGVHYANYNQGAVNVYTDDVKLGTSRLGCN